MDFRKLLNTLDSVQLNEAVEIKAERRVQDTGSLTNFNIKRDDSFKLFTGLRNGGDNYSRDDVVKVYYMNDDRLQAFLAHSDGRGAQEVDADGNPYDPDEEDQGDASYMANTDADGGATTAAAPDNRNTSEPTPTDDGKIRLSDGTELEVANEQDRNAAAQKLDELIRKYNDLIGRMNESVPTSLRGYLKEYNLLEAFVSEALSAAEQEELRNVIADINALIDGNILSEPNTAAARQAIRNAPDLPAAGATATGTDSADAPGEEGNLPQINNGDEIPEEYLDADGNPDWSKIPNNVTYGTVGGVGVERPPSEAGEEGGEQGGEQGGETAGSLEAFASSGKGGLANDADEVDAIKELQQYLTDLGFDPNGVDGKYGPGTIRGVKAFQEWMGAKVDGDAGPETIGVIIKLRSIRWGEGGSKDFKAWRETMTRMEELIGKAGSSVDETIDLNSMRGLLEAMRRLDEALSDAELEELKGIVDELRSAYDDAEFQQVLPQRVQQRFSSNFRSAEGVLADNGAGGGEEGGDEEGQPQDVATMDDAAKATAIHEGIDGMGTDEEAVLAVLGSIADEAELDRVKSAFQRLYNEDMIAWINSEVSFSEQDAVDNIINRITGDPDAPQTVEDIVSASEAADALDDALNGGFFFGLGTEEQAVLEILGRISARDFPTVMSEFERKTGTHLLTDLESELSGTDRERVNDIIKRFGYEFQDEDPGYREIGAEGGAEGGEEGGEEGQPQDPVGGEPDAQGNVQPRPTESGVQGDYARAAWDALYDGYADPQTGRKLPNGRVPARPQAPTADQLAQGAPNNQSAWDQRWAETHNADGTPKAADSAANSAADSAADSADADDPESGGEAIEQRIARYEAMPLDTDEQIRAMMQAIKDDEEVFNALPQGDQQAINTYLGS